MHFPSDLVQRHYHSPLGTMILAASDHGLALAWFDDQDGLSAALTHAPHAGTDHPVLRKTAQQFKEYFAGTRRDFDLPLDLSSGTAFQQAVWRSLLDIPYRRTCSYGTVAQTIAKPRAVRAVGAAVGSNPIAIIVPCHRVIGANGSLTGYAGGLDRKTYLLQLENGLNPQRSLI